MLRTTESYFISALALPGEEVTLEVEGTGGVALAGLAALRGEAVVLRKTHLASLTRHPGVTITFLIKIKLPSKIFLCCVFC